MSSRVIVCLMVIVALTPPLVADEALRTLRLEPVVGGETVTTTAATAAEVEAEIAAQLTERYPAFDANDPACRSLLWFYRHWLGGHGERRAVSERYYNIGVEHFNHCQQILAAVEATALPEAAKVAWRRKYGYEVIELRLALPVELERERLRAIPTGGKAVIVKDAAALSRAVTEAWPEFGAAPSEQRYRHMAALATINPDLKATGWYATQQPGEVDALHATVSTGDGWYRVARYELATPAAVYLPKPDDLDKLAEPTVAPTAEPSAAVHDVDTYRATLTDLLPGNIPVELHLVLVGDELSNVWAFTPTISNRPHKVVLTEPDPVLTPDADAPVQAKLWLAVPIADERTVQLTVTVGMSADGIRLVGGYRGMRQIGDDDLPHKIEGELAAVSFQTSVDAIAGDWPWFMGPNDSGATASEHPLVENMEHARLAWTSDLPIPCGRGPDTRGKIRPVQPGQTLSGGWASPVLAEDRIYVTYFEPSGEHYAFGADKEAARPDTDPHHYRMNLIEADDVVHCFDARTGRTLWRRVFAGAGMSWSGFNKSGPECSPAIAGGRLYVMGTLGHVYALDAATGRTLWISDIGRRHRLLAFQREQHIRRSGHYTSRSDFSTRAVVAEDVAVFCDHVRTKGGDDHYRYEMYDGLIGFDVRTGQQRWHLPGVGGGVSRWVHDGKVYLLAGDRRGIHCIDPREGKVLWSLTEARTGLVPMAVAEDRMICGSQDDPSRVVCYDLTLDGATKAWGLNVPWNHSTAGAISEGIAYLATHQGPLVAVDLESGLLRGELGDRIGMAFNVVCGDRLLHGTDQSHVKGDLTLAAARPGEFRVLSRWYGPLAGAYTTPITAPFVDGRAFLRLTDRLVCYDLREVNAVRERPHGPPESAARTAAPPQPILRDPGASDLPDLDQDMGLEQRPVDWLLEE